MAVQGIEKKPEPTENVAAWEELFTPGGLIPLISATVPTSDMTFFEQFSLGMQARFFIWLCSRGKQLDRLADISLRVANETRAKPNWATGAKMARQPGLVTGDDGHKTAIAGLVSQSPFIGKIRIGIAASFRLRIVFPRKSAAR